MIGIYGANGFLGRALLDRMGARGASIRAVSRKFGADLPNHEGSMVEIVEADLRDPIAMASSLQGIETVVQLISTSSPGLQNQHNVSDIEENVIPHVAFIQSAINAGVKKYVFVSSGGTVYGPGAQVPISEDSPTNPISSHGLTKLTIEKYLQMYGYVDRLDFVILRVSNPFGPGQVFRKGQGLIPAVLDRYKKGLPVHIYGDGAAQRDYVFIDDVVDAMELVVTKSDVCREIFNVGSGIARSILEVLSEMESVFNIHFKREYREYRKTDVDVNVLDVSKAKRLLGWVPKTEFAEGLSRFPHPNAAPGTKGMATQ